MARRDLAKAAAAAAAVALMDEPEAEAAAKPAPGGLCLNEDDSHYFGTRAGQKLDAETVASWVDQYAGTQVRELMLCPNCMRTSYDSKVWDPIWRGYDPAGPDDQPLLASTPADGRKGARDWIHTALQLHQAGIDPYALWIARARKRGMAPWITMRMNDVHCVDDERSYIHSEFWRSRPELRRTPYRFAEWVDRAFDHGHKEVRDYHLALVRELIYRYDFDGLELDWMRFGFHLRPGRELEDAPLLTEFTATVRKWLDAKGRRTGRRIRLGARVPSRPETARNLGLDAAEWARRGLVDMLVITPFWASCETDMPVETWRTLLRGTRVTLAAGLEILLRPYPGYGVNQTNSLETVRGAAASLLDRGADRIYLFNYMDSQTAMDDLANYPALLRECGDLATLAGKPRRHVVTYADTWAPGEPHGSALPMDVGPGRWSAIRIQTGPKPLGQAAEAALGIEGTGGQKAAEWQVRLNGARLEHSGELAARKPGPAAPMHGWRVPPEALQRGHNLVEVHATDAGRIVWAEISVS